MYTLVLPLRHHSTPSCALTTANRAANNTERLSIDATIPRPCFHWIPVGLTWICLIWFSMKSSSCGHFLVPTMRPAQVTRRIPLGCKSTNALGHLESQGPGGIFHSLMTLLQMKSHSFLGGTTIPRMRCSTLGNCLLKSLYWTKRKLQQVLKRQHFWSTKSFPLWNNLGWNCFCLCNRAKSALTHEHWYGIQISCLLRCG